jgi:hypothetical protein
MDHNDIEQIARRVLRDYGLQLRLIAVSSVDREGACIIELSDSCSRPTLRVPVWCGGKSSPSAVRESLKKALEVGA